MRYAAVATALAAAAGLAACTLPLAEGPTPFPDQLEVSPTTPPPTLEPTATEPPNSERITAQSLGSLYAVGEFPQDLTGELDWSPDSALLAISTIHGSGIFDVQRLLKLRPLISDVTPTSLALSPDGSLLVTGGRDIPQSPQDTVTIWQVSDGSKLQTMIGHSEWVNAVDYSPTGELVASGSDDMTVRLWRVEQATEALALLGHSAPVTTVAFSPDGQVLASGSLDGTVRLWQVGDGQLLMELPQGELGVNSVVFAPDGTTLAAGSADGVIRLFAVGSGALLAELIGNERSVNDLDFSPDGSLLVSAGGDHSLRFWQVGSGIQLHVLAAHNQPILGVGFSPDGRYVASGSLDGSVVIWGLGAPLTAAPTPEPVTDPIEYLAAGTGLIFQELYMFTADQGWASGGTETDLRHLFRTEDGGVTWLEVTPLQSAEPFPGYELALTGAFHDPYTGWIVYYPIDYLGARPDSRLIHTWRTSDGGAAWAEARPQAAMELNEGAPLVSFADDQFGWILAEGFAGVGQHVFTLLRTIDSGFAWEALQQPPESLNTCHKTGLDFFDAEHGWFTEDCPPELGKAGLLSTADGGNTFDQLDLPAPEADPDFFERAGCGPHSPQLFGPGTGILAVECAGASGGYLYRTDDNGQNWTVQSYPGGELRFMDQQVGWALSQRIYKTVDGGSNWVLVKTVNWQGNFSFVSAELGWAIASNDAASVLVRTRDGAQTWQLLEPTVGP